MLMTHQLRWPEPIYMRFGYVLKSSFSAGKIWPISMIFGILNPIQTGLFWSICDWGGGSSDPPSVSLEPIMLGS